MSKFKTAIGTLAVIALTFAAAIGFSMMTARDASATLSEDDIYINVLGNMMKKCYDASEMNATVNIQAYNSYATSTPTNAFNDFILNGGSTMLKVPTGIGTGNNLQIMDGDVMAINCKALFLGYSGSYGSMTGLFDLSGRTLPQPGSSSLVNQLKDLGYTVTVKNTDSTKCINAWYTNTVEVGGGSTSAGSICWDKADLESGDIVDYPTLAAKANPIVGEGAVAFGLDSTGGGGNEIFLSFRETGGNTCQGPEVSFNGTTASDVVNALGSSGCSITDYYGTSLYNIDVELKEQNAGSAVTDVKMQNYGLAYRAARNYLAGNGNMYNFAKQDKYDLYKLYLDKVYNVSYGSSCKKRSAVEKGGGPVQDDGHGGKTYYVYYNGGYVTVTAPADKANLDVAIFKDNNNFLEDKCDGLECLLKKIYDLNLPETGTCSTDPKPTPVGAVDEMSCDEIVKKAAPGEKIGAMQWILCPSMDNTRYTASWIDSMEEKWLSIDTKIYDSSSDTKKVWELVRNIANVIMIVFLMVIIFSQITGYGIDNYGVKKMLPRLIVMAIVVNLSFYICELAIDLSNIAGTGLRNMFASLGNMLGHDKVQGTSFLGTMITGIFATAGGASTAVGAGLTVASIGAPVAVAVIIAVIVLCLVILVAVVILFLMLGAREIIVIVCIIVAPLAFAAFILPNTQNLFKKWWDLFKAAIIIFPICGAMSGISYLLRSMAIGGHMELSMWGFAIMMVLPYLGFFLLPMLLKNAISALGKVGGALTSMGQTIRNGGRQLGQAGMRVAQNTETYKNLQTEAARRRQSDSSQRTIDRLEALKKQRESEGGQLTERETRQLARAHETQRKLSSEDTAARTILTERDYAGRSQVDLINDWERAFDSGNIDDMNALTNVITSKYGPGGVNDMASRLANKEIFDASGRGFVGGENGAMARSFTALQSNMMQNSALSNAMQSKASDAYQMITSGGYDGDGKARHNMAYHSMYNNIATQDKDWATQSSATLRRAAASGALDAQTAQNILNSTDPTIMSGIRSDKGKREVLEAAASGQLATAKSKDPDVAQTAAAQWNDKNNVTNAAQSYQRTVEKAEMDVRDEERRQLEEASGVQRETRDTLKNIEGLLRDRGNNGGDNNGGQGFDGGAGI